jgi:hypothetical protein
MEKGETLANTIGHPGQSRLRTTMSTLPLQTAEPTTIVGKATTGKLPAAHHYNSQTWPEMSVLRLIGSGLWGNVYKIAIQANGQATDHATVRLAMKRRRIASFSYIRELTFMEWARTEPGEPAFIRCHGHREVQHDEPLPDIVFRRSDGTRIPRTIPLEVVARRNRLAASPICLETLYDLGSGTLHDLLSHPTLRDPSFGLAAALSAYVQCMESVRRMNRAGYYHSNISAHDIVWRPTDKPTLTMTMDLTFDDTMETRRTEIRIPTFGRTFHIIDMEHVLHERFLTQCDEICAAHKRERLEKVRATSADVLQLTSTFFRSGIHDAIADLGENVTPYDKYVRLITNDPEFIAIVSAYPDTPRHAICAHRCTISALYSALFPDRQLYLAGIPTDRTPWYLARNVPILQSDARWLFDNRHNPATIICEVVTWIDA